MKLSDMRKCHNFNIPCPLCVKDKHKLICAVSDCLKWREYLRTSHKMKKQLEDLDTRKKLEKKLEKKRVKNAINDLEV